ncbi:MAG: sugar ABC transporter permease [Defluviitaleaceae bacterium]|nr:sugar ABC transporter permease [Defluviitaleaceae bacterium]
MLRFKLARQRGNMNMFAYLYLLPAFVLLGIFTIYPLINTIITSFRLDYRFLTGDFVRFSAQHYVDILRDPVFWRACINTAFIAFICVPASMAAAMGTATLLHSIKRLKGFFTTLYFLPEVTNIMAAGMVFALLFNNNFGLINMVLGWFGFDPVAWISGVGIAGSRELYMQAYLRCLFVLFVYSVWSGFSLQVILFLGALSRINPQYYQASSIDGVGRWKTFWKITFPLLSPTTLYVYITSAIIAFRAFAAIVALFGPTYGPLGDDSRMMITIVGYIMDSLGNYLSPGAVSMASAAAVVLLVIIMVLTALQMRLSKRWVHYS